MWYEALANTTTDVSLFVGHLLKNFNLHLGGEVRFSPFRPVHVHQAKVGEVLPS